MMVVEIDVDSRGEGRAPTATVCTLFAWLITLLEAADLPIVFTLGKEPFALGKGFA